MPDSNSDSVITPRTSLIRFIADHNPFFLLSAVCMLGGCLALTNSLSWSPIRLQRLVALVITLNVYELILIGLALFLIVKRRLARDGTILLMLEAAKLSSEGPAGGLKLQGLVVFGDRLIQVSLVFQHHAQVEVQLRPFRIDQNGPFELLARFVQATQILQNHGQVVRRWRRLGPQLDRSLGTHQGLVQLIQLAQRIDIGCGIRRP